jgi:NAD(P)-dependent dehydrogenase (short-subunit alcohol dehydrogenase family)
VDLKLKGKRALVTGSTAGIGFAIALGLAREGAAVVVNGRTDGKVSEAIKRIATETAADVIGLAADLGAGQEVDQLLAELGPVDIIVKISASSSLSRSSKFPTPTGFVSSRQM